MHKYLRLLSDLEDLIQSHPYKEGDKLPSIRTLAQQYGCSISTVIRAMGELEHRDMIYSMPKSGYYVVQRSRDKNQRAARIIDFASAAPDPDIFPYLDFRHCINKAIDAYRNDLFIYGTPQGLASLIEVVRKQLTDYQVFASQRNIFITSGVQQALSLLATIPFPNGKKKIVIEQPCYHLFIEHLQTYNHDVIGVERTAAGINLQKLEHIFRTEDIKFFYTMPRFHNPLGTSYSAKEKRKIAVLAAKYDVYIVEDDYLADFEEDSRADPLYAYDDSSHVIYLKSYSKIIFPGLRVGIAVLPDTLTEVFNRYKRVADIDSSMLSQAALEIYIKSGMFERHKQKIRTSYARKSKLLADALQQHIEQDGGIPAFDRLKNPYIHTHIVLDPKISVSSLASQLRQRSVLVDPAGKNYLAGHPQKKFLKLNASNVDEDNIEPGIRVIAEELRKAMK
ncbi:PLP-dependent aminotransferase family protein [Paenibacillus sp. sptzw28]|uniref:aminotransferase-like domain-containing protein n=1 Tax=Paenibacillus sp. sptzw28 TaxID=715179 RepID=UPI001C6F0DA8|nr:PLP-dependent aminotransferase family protein [Paenibacillus sp. sptzw28]QYR21833.1 PLP-dependent aminotransferase family protein [Paenibacillus sp. sptzw28]